MGRVKQWAEDAFEAELAKKEVGMRIELLELNQVEPSDEQLSLWDKEFEAWLDAYESSFGDGEPT